MLRTGESSPEKDDTKLKISPRMAARLTGLLLGAAPMFLIPAAQAHTTIVKTVPQYKSIVQVLPTQISIEFSDELMILGSKAVNEISVADPSGKDIKIGLTQVMHRTLIVDVPPANYEDGTYLVSYRAVSADGHVVSGSYDLYLNHPSLLENELQSADSQHTFLHIHKIHILESLFLGFTIVIWAIWYRKYRR